MTIPTLYEEYVNGTVSPVQALRSLCMALGEVESELQPLTVERELLRQQIGDIVAQFTDQKAMVRGFGLVRITAPALTEKYDTKQVDKLVTWLTDEGHTDIAESLAACKAKGMRSGGLRIEREPQ